MAVNTIAAHAIPARSVTNRPVLGGPAIPVKIYATAPTDRPVEGSLAKPIVILTAADLAQNGGMYHVAGSLAIPIYTAPASLATEGGPAIPVYVVP